MDKLKQQVVAFGKRNKACMALAYRALRGKAGRRLAAAALSLCMLFTLLPTAALGASSVTRGAVCENHGSHDEGCGYKGAVAAQPCSHRNEDGSYSCAPVLDSGNVATASDADYVCDHADDCGYAEAVEGAPCTHKCELCEGKDSGVVLPLITGFATLDEAIRTQRVGADDLVLPETLLATVDGAEIEIPVTWDGLDAVNEARKSGGLFVLTANVGEGYQLAEGVTAPTISAMILGMGRILGAGTEANPLQLRTEAQLREIAALTNAGTLSETVFGPGKTDMVYIKLMNDLDISGSQWTPIGTITMDDEGNPDMTKVFNGVFDGNGKTIKGLTIDDDSAAVVGLFGATNTGSEVKNLTLTDVSVSGGMLGAGGVAAMAMGDISGCAVSGTVTTIGGAGGVAAGVMGDISACTFSGSVIGGGSVGGVAGSASGTVSNCYSTATVTGSSSGVGGVVGSADGAVSNCYATGTVSGDTYVGGVVGGASNGASVINCAGLNPSVSSATDSSYGACRVFLTSGRADSSDNIAFAGMKLVNNSGSGIGHDSYHGADITDLATLKATYEKWNDDTSSVETVTSTVFDDTTVWNTFDGTTLPTLKGVGPQTLARPAYLHADGVSPFDGTGTDVDPYQIATAEQLRELARLVNSGDATYNANGKYFKLTADLDISGSEWTPIGNDSNNFDANFDGDGKTITGLTINQPTMDYVGLFGKTSGTIQNLGVINASVTGGRFVGGVVGVADGAVSGCYATGSITGTDYVGGVVGAADGTITNCYSTATVTGSSEYVGGVVGGAKNVTDCYATGAVSGKSKVGGVVGGAGGAVTNCVALNPAITVTGSNHDVGRVVGHTTGTISGCIAFAGMTVNGSKVTGGAATDKNGANITDLATLDGKFTDATVWNTFDGTTLPTLKGVGQQTLDRPAHLLATPFKGAGTQADPYQISTADQLRHLGTLVNGGDTTYNATGKYIKLTADLDISGSEWTPIGNDSNSFMANFDGDGKTITGLTINQPTMNYVGLFGYATGTIQNLGVINVSVVGNDNVGGVVGYTYGAVSNCYSTGSVTGSTTYVGGVVGITFEALSNCYSTGSVTGATYAGGVVGYAYGAITNCYSTATVTGTSNLIGGVTGGALGSVTNCYSTGAVTGTDYVGGVVGDASSSTVSNCVALNPTITATGSNVGRVAGFLGSSSVSGSYAFADMTVNGAVVTGGTATDNNGADATKASLKTANWWKTTAAFPEASWVLADNNLPALKTTGGTLIAGQKTDLPVFLTELPPPVSAAQKLVADLNDMQPGTAVVDATTGNVKLLKDITLAETITIAGDLTLDTQFFGIAGKAGTGGSNGISAITITTSAKVTITGSGNIVGGDASGGGRSGIGVVGDVTLSGSVTIVGGNSNISGSTREKAVDGTITAGTTDTVILGGNTASTITTIVTSGTSSSYSYIKAQTVTVYTITKTNATNGSFTVKVGTSEVTQAAAGATVTITPTPTTGYVVDAVTVTKTGASDTVTVNNNSFTMPAYGVTVSVSFKASTTSTPAQKLVNDLNAMQANTAKLDTTTGNVKLLQNITLTGTITIAGDLTLDTQTFAITGKAGADGNDGSGSDAITITSPAKVTITGSVGGGIVGGAGGSNSTHGISNWGGIGVKGAVTLSGSVSITGGAGGSNTGDGAGGRGGDSVFGAVTLGDSVSITGGAGGAGTHSGGSGGRGVLGNATASGSTTVTGGKGGDGTGTDKDGGDGGVGISGTTILSGNATATGGKGGDGTGTGTGGTGGMGVAGETTLNDSAKATGGNGGNTTNGKGGDGDTGVSGNATLSGSAKATGGNGGNGSTGGKGGKGTWGDTTLSGSANVTGGNCGNGGTGIIGGNGVYGSATLSGSATVTGGAGSGGTREKAVEGYPSGTITAGTTDTVILGGNSDSAITNVITSGTSSNYSYIKAQTTYTITKTNTTNGSFTVKVGANEVTRAAAGDTVTITPTPTTGYVVDAVTVTKTGASDTVTVANNSFTMPTYPVTVSVSFKAHKPVSSITGIPTTATANVSLLLTGTVNPADATNKTIVWSVKTAGDTGATITDNRLSTTAAGTVVVTATIINGAGTSTDYTQDIAITVSAAPTTDAEKIAAVKAAIESVLSNYAVSNATTAQDILDAATGATSNGVIVAGTVNDFTKITATEDATGSITSSIKLTLNSETATVVVNRIIPKLEVTLYTVTLDANGGAVSPTSLSVAAGGTAALPTPTHSGSYRFEGWFTATSGGTQYTSATPIRSNVTLYARWTYTGGSFSEDNESSSGGSTAVVTPPTPENPGAPTESEIKVPGTVDGNGNATATVTDKAVSDAIKQAEDTAKKNGNLENGITLVLNVDTGSKTATSVSVNLPKITQETVISKKIINTVIVVNNPNIQIGIDLAAVSEINAQAKADVNISATRMENEKLTGEAKTAIGNRPAFDLKATYQNGSKRITNFGGGSVSVALPYALQAGEVPGGLYAVYVDENGNVSHIANSSYDAQNKVLRFSTNHFSVYGIGYTAPVNFTDIADHWARTDIEFVINRGLMNGTGSTTFSPDGSMTRGMFVTALGRLAGIDSTKYTNTKFSDVETEAYHAPYVAWATEKGVTVGTSTTTFSPDKIVTRQEMAVFMARYAEAMGYQVPATREAITFADSSSIGSWAATAVKQMQMAGVLKGKSNYLFDPTGTATRGEIAAVLRRYVELIIDPA